MRPTREECLTAVMVMAEVIPFFPESEPAKQIIRDSIHDFVGDIEHLTWLVKVSCRTLTRWRGIAELRAIFCTRYPPADGLPITEPETPGFRLRETEAQALEAYQKQQAKETSDRILQWKREAQQLPAPERRENYRLLTRAHQTNLKLIEAPTSIKIKSTSIRSEQEREAEVQKVKSQLAERALSREG